MLNSINLLASLLLSLICGWAVMSQGVKDGIIIKFGLTVVSIGSLLGGFSSLESTGIQPRLFASTVVSVGLLVCVAGYLLRTHVWAPTSKQRRASDWSKTV